MANSLHTSFQACDLHTLQEWVNTGRSEDLWLEFKRVTRTEFARDDQKNLATLLSAFANSDGGLIVWGIGTRKDAEGGEVASELLPVPDPGALVSHLQGWTGGLVSPGVEGVDHRAIPAGDGSGFAITYVPASDGGPHMARAGDDRYYKRNGARSLKMEHFEIEDMFGRRARPNLHLVARIQATLSMTSALLADTLVGLRLENRGRGIARFPLLALAVPETARLNHQGGPLQHLEHPSPSSGRFHVFAGGADQVIHPGTSRQITSVIRHAGQPAVDLCFEYQTAADGQPMREDRLVVTRAELAQAHHKP